MFFIINIIEERRLKDNYFTFNQMTCVLCKLVKLYSNLQIPCIICR